jgi:hypothetical protein
MVSSFLDGPRLIKLTAPPLPPHHPNLKRVMYLVLSWGLMPTPIGNKKFRNLTGRPSSNEMLNSRVLDKAPK